MEQIVNHFYMLSQARVYDKTETLKYIQQDYFLNEIGSDTSRLKEFQKLLKKLVKKKFFENKTFQYMITFTCDPRKIDIDDEIALKENENYILERLQRPALQITRLEFVREGTDKDHKHAHWHCGVVSKRYLEKDMFKTYIKNVGKIKCEKSKRDNFDDILVYINKTHKSTPILNL